MQAPAPEAIGRKEFISQEEADSWVNPNERKPGEHFRTWGARLLKRWNDLDLGEKDRPENLRECGLLCHDLEQYDPKATRLPKKEELEEDEKCSGKDSQVPEEDPEAGPDPSTQANREGLPPFPQIKDQEDEEEAEIVFIEKKRDPARQHPNLNPMSVWEGKVPSSSNPAYAFNKQQDNSADPTNFEASYLPTYHRGNMQAILSKNDIAKHITQSVGEIDRQIEKNMKEESGKILLRIESVFIEFYTYYRAEGGSFIPTPKKLANSKCTINPDNHALIDLETNRPSEKCLQGALGAYFAYQDGHTEHLEQIFRAKKLKPYLDIVKLDGIPMPTPVCPRTFQKIEEMNPDISINV